MQSPNGRFPGVKVKLLFAAALLPVAAMTGARASDQPLRSLDLDPALFPGLTAFAEVNKIPVSSIGVPDPMVAPKPADRVTFVVALHDQSGVREWLIDLSEVELSAAHKAAPPPGTRTVYSAIGGKYPIASAWAEESVRISGVESGFMGIARSRVKSA